jgi:hypothetical protein
LGITDNGTQFGNGVLTKAFGLAAVGLIGNSESCSHKRILASILVDRFNTFFNNEKIQLFTSKEATAWLLHNSICYYIIQFLHDPITNDEILSIKTATLSSSVVDKNLHGHHFNASAIFSLS